VNSAQTSVRRPQSVVNLLSSRMKCIVNEFYYFFRPLLCHKSTNGKPTNRFDAVQPADQPLIVQFAAKSADTLAKASKHLVGYVRWTSGTHEVRDRLRALRRVSANSPTSFMTLSLFTGVSSFSTCYLTCFIDIPPPKYLDVPKCVTVSALASISTVVVLKRYDCLLLLCTELDLYSYFSHDPLARSCRNNG